MWPFQKSQRIEDPERLRRFLGQLQGADWRGDPAGAFEKVASALNDLIYHEVLFYYRARKQQRRFSILTRGLAVLFGTLGVMVPLLAGADPQRFGAVTPYGYPLLAVAAALLAVNRMFGATGGHIRYVTAQLELEKIITRFQLTRLEWQSRDTGTHTEPATAAQAFAAMNTFVDDAYRVIQEETTVWGKTVSEALSEYQDRLSQPPGMGG